MCVFVCVCVCVVSVEFLDKVRYNVIVVSSVV